MLTANCSNCGAPKNPVNYADPVCGQCAAARDEAIQGFAAEHPDSPNSDALYAGRTALMNRAHYARRNFIDPRAFAGIQGMIPKPPQTDRGGPA